MPPAKPRRVLGYARVSSTEQALGTSLGDQQERIKREAKARDVKAEDVLPYVEAESGIYEKHERREEMKRLMHDVRAGDLVIVDKLDRWSRDPEVTYRSIREIQEKGARIYFVSEALDPSTAQGEMALGMWATFARSEHRRIKERMVGTRNLLQSRGYYASGSVPLGYRRPTNARERTDKNVLVIVPEEAEIVRTIFRRYVAGESMTKLARDLGLKLDRIKDVLHRRLYIGEVQGPPSAPGKRDGEWVKGHHKPIIDADLWHRAQDTIKQRTLGGPRPRDAVSETSTWILRDVACCGRCGAKMAAAYAGPKDEGRRYYYRCTKKCTSAYVPMRTAEEAAADAIEARLAALRVELGKPPAKHAEPRDRKTEIAAKREGLKQRRERYLEQNADGFIDRAKLHEKMTKVDAELAKLDAQEAALAKPPALSRAKVRQEMLQQVREIERACGQLEAAEMRGIVNALVTSCGLVSGKAPSFVWRTAEELHERLDVVRENLMQGLRRAPSHAEIVEALFSNMAAAPMPRRTG